MITGVHNSLISFVIIHFWMLMWNMKYHSFSCKKPQTLCFPFSCDNLSSKKFLKFSFLRVGIYITQFGDPHRSFFCSLPWAVHGICDLHRPEVIPGAQHQWTQVTINPSLHATTPFCHLPVCLVAAVLWTLLDCQRRIRSNFFLEAIYLQIKSLNSV